jgi:hypothetical protein
LDRHELKKVEEIDAIHGILGDNKEISDALAK